VSAQLEPAIGALHDALACRRALAHVPFFAGRTEEAEPLAWEAVTLLEALPARHELAMAYNTISQRRRSSTSARRDRVRRSGAGAGA
jgi:hypothetical protein